MKTQSSRCWQVLRLARLDMLIDNFSWHEITIYFPSRATWVKNLVDLLTSNFRGRTRHRTHRSRELTATMGSRLPSHPTLPQVFPMVMSSIWWKGGRHLRQWMVNIFPFSYLSFTLRLQPGDFTEECAENGTEPKAIVRSNSKSVSGGGTRDPSRKGERPEKPLKDQDKVYLLVLFCTPWLKVHK